MTTMQIDRAVIEQALEVLDEADTFHRNLPDQRARRLAAMTALRAALAQQDEPVEDVLLSAAGLALDALEHDRQATARAGRSISMLSLRAIEELRGVFRNVLAQQAEPVHDRHGACPTHCCPVHGCKYMHDDCPVVSGAVQPVYPRNNGCESCADDALAQQDEPVPAAVVATQSDVWRGCNGQWQAPGEPIKMVRVLLRDLPTGTLLYTAPPQRKPLVDPAEYDDAGAAEHYNRGLK